MPTPNVVTPAIEAEMLRLWLLGKTQQEIADAIGVHYTTVGPHLRRLLNTETPAWKGAGRVAVQRIRLPKPFPEPVEYPPNPPKLKTPCELTQGEAQRFWAHTTPPNANGCRLWVLSKSHGYGQVGVASPLKVDRAHRVAWRLTYGPIPEGKDVLHRCDVRPCVEPTHLWLGNDTENMADMAAKGRRRNRPGKAGEDNVTAKLTWEKVRLMRKIRNEQGLTVKQLAKRFHVSESQVSNILTGKQWVE